MSARVLLRRQAVHAPSARLLVRPFSTPKDTAGPTEVTSAPEPDRDEPVKIDFRPNRLAQKLAKDNQHTQDWLEKSSKVVLDAVNSPENIEKRAAVQAEHVSLAATAAHLMLLRKSGMRIAEYAKEAPELATINEFVQSQKDLMTAQITERELRKRDGDSKIHDPEYQLLQARKIREFAQAPQKSPKTDVVEYLVNLVMRHGKKTVAQRLVNHALVILRMRTKQDPIEALNRIVDETAPLVRILKFKQGAKSISFPAPLQRRQRNRRALIWLLDDAKSRPSPSFGVRLGDTLAAMYNSLGKPTGLASDRKNKVHRAAIESRANIPKMRI